MDNSQKKHNFSPARTFFAGVFGVSAILCILTSGAFGYFSPISGVLLFAVGILEAVIFLFCGIVCRSTLLRRFSYITILTGILVVIAGAATLFIDQKFEDRCVEDWQNLLNTSEKIEKRLDTLEDRFDND